MDSVIKIQHLANYLGEEPAESLKGIKCVGVNFQTAWSAVCNRYDNTYLRYSVQMETLVHMPSAKTEQVKHLCHLINTMDESINTFTALDRPCKHWDDIYINFIESKLANSTRLDWLKEKERKKVAGGFAKYPELKSFLEERIRSLDVVHSRIDVPVSTECGEFSTPSSSSLTSFQEKKWPTSKKKMKSTGAHVAMPKHIITHRNPICSFCKGEHFIGYCPKFSVCPQAQRRAHAASAKLCFNCLKRKGRCFVCGNKHHTELHTGSSKVANAVATADDFTNEESLVAHAGSPQIASLTVTTTSKVLLSTACVELQAGLPDGDLLSFVLVCKLRHILSE